MIFSLTKKVLKNFEKVKIYDLDQNKTFETVAKVDTGADRTSIDLELAKKLNLLTPENIITTKNFRSGLGREERKIIKLTYKIKGKIVHSEASVTSRKHLNYQVLIGVKDMAGFLVDPDRKNS